MDLTKKYCVKKKEYPCNLDFLLKGQYNKNKMDCWHCGTELIWGGDHDLEEEFYGEDHAYDFVTNLSCPKCQSYVEVYHRKDS